MESFLKQVATELYKRTDGDLAHTAVIFPNKRASLFFNEYLAQQSDKPIWAPTYLSISELFQSLSTLKVCDDIQAVCTLYQTYTEVTHSAETLDDFYFWGELLISDFDDVDKNMADAPRLFSNVEELTRIAKDVSYLDPEQVEAINKFLKNFSIEKETLLKEKFKSIWNSLGEIYRLFKIRLLERGVAYEGMLYREVTERMDQTILKYDKYVFVGFNVLNKVEHQLFEYIQQTGKALFFWDYDTYYLSEHPKESMKFHEAGAFLQRNLNDFPNALTGPYFDNLSRPKEIAYIASPTENAQTRYLPTWLKENLTENEKETAVVLCNETLLQPVLHALPPEVKHVNITMGFPLSQTPVYSFVKALLDLHIQGYNNETGRYTYQSVAALLKHPYTCQLSSQAEALVTELTRNNRFFPFPTELMKDDVLTTLFMPLKPGNLSLCIRIDEAIRLITGLFQAFETEDTANTIHETAFNQLYSESLFKVYTTVNRFRTLIENGELNVRPVTMQNLLVRILSAMSIPFHGEPAIGLQVMGVLETRNLDFKHLILLSVNEGQLPKGGMEASFIPYNLRKAFGLTTIEHKMAVYAYYFYRLLQRSDRVTLLYNTSTDGMNKGEWSRFMLQFLIEGPHEIKQYYLEAEQSPQEAAVIEIPKTPSIIRKLRKRFDINLNPQAYLSPTALNAYIDCSLKFYFRYVAGLKAPDEVNADIDSPTFGNIFHKAAERIYNDLKDRNNRITKDRLEALLKDEHTLQEYVNATFKEEFFKIKPEEKADYNGLQLINYQVILQYIKQLIRLDMNYTPFTYEGAEQKVDDVYEISIPESDEVVKVHIGGIIDRMDSQEGTLRIVDYKTGQHGNDTDNVEKLFLPNRKDGSNYIFQTFLYSDIIVKKEHRAVKPALLYIQKAAQADYRPDIFIGTQTSKKAVEDYREWQDEFREHLARLLVSIFREEGTFTQTDHEKNCEYCDFKAICKR